MGKRKGRRAELPLFDLPLRPTSGESSAADAPPADEAPRPEETPGSRPAVAPGPALEEGDRDGAGEGAEQLDLVELTGPKAEAAPPAATPAATAGEEDERALLGDRLLAGLADLAVQLVASGLALAAAHSLGVAVSWSDWMPFGVLALVFSFFYWVVPLAFWGRTPGMAWVGHSARAAGGEPLTFGQTFRRWLGALFTLTFAGLPLLLALTGRSFSDRISDSFTVADP